jgi:hypothetical protein
MKIPFIALAAFFLSGNLLFAEMDTIHTDVRVAAFYPQDSLFREIYGNWQIDYELEVGKLFLKNYEAWANINWMRTSGHSSLGNHTSFQDLNFSIGGKYVFKFGTLKKFYLGLGINDAWVYVHNQYNYVKKRVYKNWIGGVAKMGFYVEPVEHLFIDVFIDYLYQQIRFADWQQIGGLKLGAGLGFCF